MLRLEPYYNITKPEELVGHLVIGLAPHTSAGVLPGIVGFTRANVGYAHPVLSMQQNAGTASR